MKSTESHPAAELSGVEGHGYLDVDCGRRLLKENPMDK